jgi:c-di-GMP-binding flagellar brake protein YcgR
MTESRKYPRCDIAGTGELTLQTSEKKYKFKLLDMSADGIKVLLEEAIESNQNVSVNICLKNYIFEVKIKAQGIVIRSEKADTLYECVVEFTDIQDSDREEINEMMMSSCNLIY